MLGMNTTSMPFRLRIGATCGMRRCAEGMSRMAYDRKGLELVVGVRFTKGDRMFVPPAVDDNDDDDAGPRCLVCSAIQFSTWPT